MIHQHWWCTSSNILVKEIEHTGNHVLATINILVKEIEHTSNYVDSLRLRINSLEGTEGRPGDVNLTPPLPPIPPTGIITTSAGITTVTVVCRGEWFNGDYFE
jgi:hypothetical protein